MKIRNGGIRPGVWCELRRAGRGDVDMPDVHDDSAAADDEPRPTAAAVDAAAPFTNTCKGWNRGGTQQPILGNMMCTSAAHIGQYDTG